MKYRYRTDEEMKDSGVEWLGNIPKEWINTKLAREFQIGSGTTPLSTNLQYYDGSINWLLTGDLNDNYIYNTSNKITEKALNDYSTLKLYPKNSLVVAMYGATIGKTGITKIETTTNQACCVLYKAKKLKIKFTYYWFIANKKEIINLSRGGGQPNISQNLIKSLKLAKPSLNEQEKIEQFLDQKVVQFDSIISKKEALIKKIEEAKKSVISETVTGKVKVVKTENGYEVVARSNEEMKDSTIGLNEKIYCDFEVISVSNLLRKDILEIQDGNHGELHPTAKDYVDNGVPFVMASDIRNNKININACKYISFERSEKLRIGFSKAGDVLLTHKGTIGEVAVVTETNGYPYIVLTPQVTYYRLKDKADIDNFYLSYLLRSDFIQKQLKIISEMQSTRAYIGIVAQRNLKFIVPKLEEQKLIVKYLNYQVNKFDDLIIHNKAQIEKLKEAKQSLITEAVTGKIEILD
ncbi:restriction endonuclease subunit S [Clostridium botulinum]|nr:restriction endonuclease subunit S [Clostridium botulinum]